MVLQDFAIQQVVQAVCRYEDGGSRNPHAPLVLLFLGPSGCGKTELASQLSSMDTVFRPLIKFNMSQYSSEHEMARLQGAPPGYSGDRQGRLSQALKEHPNAIVLLDEIGSAHPRVLPFFLSVFDTGDFHNGLGETIRCSSALFVMTSNDGAPLIKAAARQLRQASNMEAFHGSFVDDEIRPELFSKGWAHAIFFRIDACVLFPPVLESDAVLKRELAAHAFQVNSCACSADVVQLAPG